MIRLCSMDSIHSWWKSKQMLATYVSNSVEATFRLGLWALVRLTIIFLSSDEPNPTPRCTLYFTVEEEQSFTEERPFTERLEIVPWVCSTEKQI